MNMWMDKMKKRRNAWINMEIHKNRDKVLIYACQCADDCVT